METRAQRALPTLLALAVLCQQMAHGMPVQRTKGGARSGARERELVVAVRSRAMQADFDVGWARRGLGGDYLSLQEVCELFGPHSSSVFAVHQWAALHGATRVTETRFVHKVCSGLREHLGGRSVAAPRHAGFRTEVGLCVRCADFILVQMPEDRMAAAFAGAPCECSVLGACACLSAGVPKALSQHVCLSLLSLSLSPLTRARALSVRSQPPSPDAKTFTPRMPGVWWREGGWWCKWGWWCGGKSAFTLVKKQGARHAHGRWIS